MTNISSLSPRAQRTLVDWDTSQNFVSFIQRVFETVAPGEELQLNWHINAMASALERIRCGEITRLIITVPPRHLKSITASVAFPAFCLGHDPTKEIVCISYGDDLAVKHAIDCRAVIKADWYRQVFPMTRISREKDTEHELVTTRRGCRLATSIGGTLTGRGGDIIIIDDPLKPEDAQSEVSRERLKRWFETTLLSRQNDKATSAIIVVMQRLHVDDLVGFLLENPDSGWVHLDLQAIAEEPVDIPLGPNITYHRDVGDVLDPKREPKKVLDQLKASMGTTTFSAQYQQRPVPAEGNIIKRAWLSFYDVIPTEQPDDTFLLSWDTAMAATEIANYSVGTAWLVRKDHCYLLDLVRDRFDFPSLLRTVVKLRNRWTDATTLVEDKASGTSLIQSLRKDGFSVIAIKPEADKVTRLYTVQPQFESRSVHFPRAAPWLADLMAELLAFPGSRHNDQVDSISQALTWIVRRRRLMNNDIGMPRSFPREDRYPFPSLIGVRPPGLTW